MKIYLNYYYSTGMKKLIIFLFILFVVRFVEASETHYEKFKIINKSNLDLIMACNDSKNFKEDFYFIILDKGTNAIGIENIRNTVRILIIDDPDSPKYKSNFFLINSILLEFIERCGAWFEVELISNKLILYVCCEYLLVDSGVRFHLSQKFTNNREIENFKP